MKVDIIIVLDGGIPKSQYAIQHTTTAEATFDKICERYMAEDYEWVLTDVDYGVRLTEANKYLNLCGIEIIWLEQVTINRYKN